MPRIVGAVPLLLLATALLLPAAGSVRAEEPSTESAGTYLDPVVRDVIRMLGEGVEPETVEQWLATSRVRPRRMSADDLIALSRAGAPESLTRRLLELAVAAPPPAAAAAPPPPRPSTASAADCCSIEFEIDYKAVEPTEGERQLPARDLFVYLDGRLLARVESRADVGGPGRFESRRRLAPGRHLVRLARERHDPFKPRKDDRPLHRSTVAPDAIELVLEPAELHRLEIRWSDGALGSDRPLTWSLTRDGEPVAGLDRGGVAKERWPSLCDDIRANVERGLTSESRARRERAGCVEWDSLWPADLGAPTRAELLEAISAGGTP